VSRTRAGEYQIPERVIRCSRAGVRAQGFAEGDGFAPDDRRSGISSDGGDTPDEVEALVKGRACRLFLFVKEDEDSIRIWIIAGAASARGRAVAAIERAKDAPAGWAHFCAAYHSRAA